MATKPVGLILDFIESELADYQEPEHRGTPRGDPVGFSAKKMRAAYELALSGKTEREIASELEVSESLIRKWLCEDSFKATMGRVTSDFRRYFARRMREPVPGRAELIPELASPAVETEIFREVSDALEREQERVGWFQAALRHTTPLLVEKRRRPWKKWIYNRAPHEEAMLLWKLEKVPGAKGPLEEAVRVLRERLYREAEQLLRRDSLREADRALARSLVEELRRSEEILQRGSAA